MSIPQLNDRDEIQYHCQSYAAYIHHMHFSRFRHSILEFVRIAKLEASMRNNKRRQHTFRVYFFERRTITIFEPNN